MNQDSWQTAQQKMPDPSARSLRPHTKSKGGCKACKIRKVKCNEQRPACTSCLRRKEPCEYDSERIRFRHMDVESNASSSSTPAPTPFSSSASPSPPYSTVEDFSKRVSTETTERRLLELELMHHFTSSTVHSGFLSAHDEDILQMWWKKTPVLAFKHPFLLNIIISIAALHITKITPQKTEMADIHRIYFNAAVSQLRHAVEELNPENAEAICISNILIALPSFILLQNPENRSYSPPFQLFSILASNISLFRAAWPMLSESSPIMAFATAEPDMRVFIQEVRQDKHRQPFLKLISWRATGEEVDEESQDAYDFALCYVGCILINIENHVHPSLLRRMLYSFPTWVPNIFVTQLKEWKPRALTILAYYFALSKAMDNVWWMRGIAEREVFGIQSILPEEWQWAMAWPMQKIAAFAALSMPSMPED